MTESHPLLLWLTFLPTAGALGILALVAARVAFKLEKGLVDQLSRGLALLTSGAVLALCIPLLRAFDLSDPRPQFVFRASWIPAWNVHLYLGTDGLSILLIVLSALISFFATIASMPWWSGKAPLDAHHFTHEKVPAYFALLLLLQTGMLGTFAALDLFLFFVFWELMLLPMYFLIAIWGGPRRNLAAIKFFLYTLAGSALLLLAILALHLRGPQEAVDGHLAHTFDVIRLAQWGRSGGYANVPDLFGFSWNTLVWIALFLGFAVKIPIVPLHTWLPDAHVEAPTPVSVILAGVLLKTGVYGILRVNASVLPQTTHALGTWIAALGAIAVVYAAFVCLAQKDLKRMIAFSSVSHMGFSLLGLGAFSQQGLEGAYVNLLTHGLISSMLFLIVGVIYDRAHHRRIDGFGGLASIVPEYGTLLTIAFFASLGLPGLCGFVSEFTVFLGALPTRTGLTIFATSSVVLTAAYYLWALQRVLLGPKNEAYANLPDVNWRERLTLWPLSALILLFGLWPWPLFEYPRATLLSLLASLQ